MTKNEPINMILSLGTRIHFHDENPSILLQYANNRDKRKFTPPFLSFVCQATHQGPGVSVGNLTLCINGKCAVCLKGRLAYPTPSGRVEEGEDPLFSDGARQSGVCGPFMAVCKPGQ